MAHVQGGAGKEGNKMRPIKKERSLLLLAKPQDSSAQGKPKHKGPQRAGQVTSLTVPSLQAAVSGPSCSQQSDGRPAGEKHERRETRGEGGMGKQSPEPRLGIGLGLHWGWGRREEGTD